MLNFAAKHGAASAQAFGTAGKIYSFEIKFLKPSNSFIQPYYLVYTIQQLLMEEVLMTS
jgi:hypothetical protein